MKTIRELTDAQKARMPEWADKWIRIGLQTGETDWKQAESALKICYEKAGLTWHNNFILNGPVRVYTGTTPPHGYNMIHARVGVGYAFDAVDTAVLTHPEHDNYVFKFDSRWQVCHQIDMRTIERAVD